MNTVFSLQNRDNQGTSIFFVFPPFKKKETALAQSPLCLLLLVRLGGYIANSLDCYSYRIIGELTAFLQLQEFSLRNMTVDSSTEAITAEGLPTNLASAEKRVLLRRIMHSCRNGHKDFDDSCVVFLIHFEKIWKYQNVMLRSSDR
jgi:hypothetical protein